MRDLQRKVDKFVKERASVKNQKSRGVSPGLNNTLSPNATIGFNSTAQSFTRITRKVNNRTFSMTVSFNPRFDVPPARDIAIYHQDRKQKNLMANPVDHAKSPKYNPILQNGKEPCFEFKAPFKATPLTGKMTIFDDEPVQKKRAGGEYKEAIQNARSLSPKGPCIKTYYAPALREEQSPEKQRRVRKGVANSLKNLFNPITEGDLENLKFRRARKGAETTKPSEETLKLNARNKLLPTEIGFSPKGRVFRDSSLVLSAHPIEDPVPAKGKRFASPQQVRRPDMQGLLEYSFSLPYRDQTISPKCTSQSFYEVVKNMGSNKE